MITREKFLEAWDKYSPTKLEKFYFKNFSGTSIDNKSKWITFFILFVPFLIGMIGTILNVNYEFIKIITFSFSFLLIGFSIPWIYIWYTHNRRIKKIVKYLNCTMKEYDTAIKRWEELVK